MFTFADSFDFYTTVNDPSAGYWDSGTSTFVLSAVGSGRFGGRTVQNGGGGIYLTKASNSNDAVHHFNIVHLQGTFSASNLVGIYLQLLDGSTNQCCVCFRSDGAIILTSGGPGGATLATYNGAVTSNVWLSFEFEVVINNTTGRFRARKNGNPNDDFDSGATLNTRGGTANNYANKLTLGASAGLGSEAVDDLLWRSDPSSVPFVGDVRAYVRMPVSDVSVQFSRVPSSVTNSILTGGGTWTSGPPVNTVWATAVTPAFTGNATAIVVNFGSNVTGHVNMALYAISGSGNTATLGALLGTCTALTNPVAGVQTFTLTASVPVVKGVPVLMAMLSDTTPLVYGNNNGNTIYALAQSYASGFPASMASFTSASTQLGFSNLGVTITAGVNSQMVNEAQQDGTTTYVYDSTVGHGDFYNIAAASPIPTTVVAVTARGFMAKSDAGTRSGAVQLKSGAFIASTTWNTSDQVNTTLSGGNLTATFTGSSTNSGVRSVYGTSSGKYYFESRCNIISNPTFGIGLATVNLATLFSTLAGSSALQGQFLYVGNAIQANIGATPVNGDVICIAVDLTAKLIWFRVNGGIWNNNAANNPATGVGGYDISSISTGSLYAMCGGQNTSGFTANFGGSAFAQVVPSGFLAGWGSGGAGTTVQSASAPLASNFTWVYRADSIDPNTGSAWTPAAVDGLQIGPVVTA